MIILWLEKGFGDQTPTMWLEKGFGDQTPTMWLEKGFGDQTPTDRKILPQVGVWRPNPHQN